jgi:hypothetical protein
MKANLRLGNGGILRDGSTGDETPAWYKVEGLPADQHVLIQSNGNPQNKWRIKRTPPMDQDKGRTFATPEEALQALQQEVG